MIPFDKMEVSDKRHYISFLQDDWEIHMDGKDNTMLIKYVGADVMPELELSPDQTEMVFEVYFVFQYLLAKDKKAN